ncbi:MAG: FtsX-like permease family protein, partial [Candidatus Aminicenantes bacterium]|nr:FtsX-like permease family protein [Candidatus Aminicenantes bacterium]
LATARFAHRSREVGVRKVLGSERRQLVVQFLGESLLLSAIALILALGLIALMLPAFGRLVQRPLVFGDVLSGGFPLLLGGVALLVGLAAGGYPALFLSSFDPQTTLKGRHAVRGKGHVLLRRGLVFVQFAVGFAVIFGTGVISRQMGYLGSRDLGFDRDHVVVIHRANALGAAVDAFESKLLAHPEILRVARSQSLPGRHFDSTGHLLEGSPATDERTLMMTYVDERFADLLGLELVAGRFFSEGHPDGRDLGRRHQRKGGPGARSCRPRREAPPQGLRRGGRGRVRDHHRRPQGFPHRLAPPGRHAHDPETAFAGRLAPDVGQGQG